MSAIHSARSSTGPTGQTADQPELQQTPESQQIMNDIQSQILLNVEPAGPSYGRDLWDQLGVIRESTELRQKQMQSVRNFFKCYKRSLDQFKDGVKKALLQFEKEVIVPQSRKGYKIGQKASNFPLAKKN